MTLRWQSMSWEFPNGHGDVASIPAIGAKVAAYFCSMVQLFTVRIGKPRPAPGSKDGKWYRVEFVAHVPADRELLNPNPLDLLAAGNHLGHVYGFDFMDNWRVERTLPEVERSARAERAARAARQAAPVTFAGPPRCKCGKLASHLALDADDPNSECLPGDDDDAVA